MRTISTCPRTPLMAIFVTLAAPSALGQSLDAEAVLSGIDAERGRLKQGSFAITGTESVLERDGVTTLRPFQIDSTFSHPTQRVFFQHVGEQEIYRNERYADLEVNRIICLLPDRTFHFTNIPESPWIAVVGPNTPSFRGMKGTRGYLDPRCLGLITTSQMYRGISFEKAMSDFAASLRDGYTLQHIGDNVYRFRRVFATNKPDTITGRRSVYVDASKGFSVIRDISEVGAIGENGEHVFPVSAYFSSHPIEDSDEVAEKMRALTPDVRSQIDVSWEEINGVWVPSSVKAFQLTQDFDKDAQGDLVILSGRSVKSEFSGRIHWSSVNEPIDESVFHYDNFDVPPSTPVFDVRNGGSVPLGYANSATGSNRRQINSRQFSVLNFAYLLAAAFALTLIVWFYSEYKRGKERG